MVRFDNAFSTYQAHSPPSKYRIFEGVTWTALSMPKTCTDVQDDPRNNDEASIRKIYDSGHTKPLKKGTLNPDVSPGAPRYNSNSRNHTFGAGGAGEKNVSFRKHSFGVVCPRKISEVKKKGNKIWETASERIDVALNRSAKDEDAADGS